MEKCSFLKGRIEFLGCRIENDTIRPDSKGIRKLSEWLEVRSKKQLQRALGLLEYYRKYMQGYVAKNKIFLWSIKEFWKDQWGTWEGYKSIGGCFSKGKWVGSIWFQ